jgi:hypothetical protein
VLVTGAEQGRKYKGTEHTRHHLPWN